MAKKNKRATLSRVVAYRAIHAPWEGSGSSMFNLYATGNKEEVKENLFASVDYFDSASGWEVFLDSYSSDSQEAILRSLLYMENIFSNILRAGGEYLELPKIKNEKKKK